jgi:hypothetical protein
VSRAQSFREVVLTLIDSVWKVFLVKRTVTLGDQYLYIYLLFFLQLNFFFSFIYLFDFLFVKYIVFET